MQEAPRCQNETCKCTTLPGQPYCSAYCANVDRSETIPGYSNQPGSCACGHAGCHPAPASAPWEAPLAVGPEGGES